MALWLCERRRKREAIPFAVRAHEKIPDDEELRTVFDKVLYLMHPVTARLHWIGCLSLPVLLAVWLLMVWLATRVSVPPALIWLWFSFSLMFPWFCLALCEALVANLPETRRYRRQWLVTRVVTALQPIVPVVMFVGAIWLALLSPLARS
jgi:hypothetical protein